uniref:Threonine synthase n=1 Tax=Herpetomonas muscarum TaxID=5718 RepID=U5KLK4_HERMU|nr:threonine synthase [Herpetomonas muscarum]
MPVPIIRMIGTADAATKDAVAAGLAAAGLGTAVSLEQSETPQSSLIVCLDAEDDAVMKPTYQNYTFRYVWTKASSVEECVQAAQLVLAGSSDAMAKRTAQQFNSTRGGEEGESFLTVVRRGLSSDGGLYMLKSIPAMAPSQLAHLCTAKGLMYVEVAQSVLEMLVGGGVAPALLYPNVLLAYDQARWSGRTDVCPVTPLLVEEHADFDAADVAHRWMNNVSVMELYHGPTAAFKDFALQLFPRYFQTAVEDDARQQQKQQQHDGEAAVSAEAKDKYIILAATSGDTGVAAISGFVNAGGHAKVMILYPMHGVSPVQQLQMLSFDDGKQVEVFGLSDDFDFCQKTVKTIFSDDALKARLARSNPPSRLSSANSINWGRLIPQVVYYVWAYRQHVQRAAQLVSTRQDNWRFGDVIDVVVPCGNFGNILAAYFAKKMGLPIRKLVVASNKNDVLFEFVQTGRYDIRSRKLAVTASPSIDILKASNVERLLFLLTDGDTAAVATMMAQLETDGVFELSEPMKQRMSETFTAGYCTEEECAATIKEVFEASRHTRLLDPHTAVAVHVAREFRKRVYLDVALDPTTPVPPLVIASTAHWAKFPEPVLHAIRGEVMVPGEPAPTPAAAIERVRRQYAEILKMAGEEGKGHIAVHPALAAAIETAEKSAGAPRSAPATVAGVQAELEKFAAL